MGKNAGYLGNPNLKPEGQSVNFTKEQIEEYIKCAKDPVYFIQKYIKVVSLDKGLVPFHLFDYQEDMINKIHDNRFIIAKLPRQSGKTTTVTSYLLHYILFNQSMNVAILANKQSTAKDILARLKLAYEYLPTWLQQGIKEWNKYSIALENGSRVLAAATSSSAIRGGSYNFLVLDEYAHVPTNVAEEFFSSVYPTITSGQTTKVAMISTPKGLNMFYHFWKGAQSKQNEYIPIEVTWNQVPKYPGGPLRDEVWKQETIRNSSERQFSEEFECDFIGSSNTLISSEKLNNLTWVKPMSKTNDGLTLFVDPVKETETTPLHTYFIVVDVARGQGKDYSALTVIDITQMPYKIVAKYRNNIISPLLFPSIIRSLGKRYNDAYVMVEQLGIRTSQVVKKLGCSVLKNLIENDKLIIEDAEIIEELTTFISTNTSFNADRGYNDDLVMTLVLFAWSTRQEFFKNLTNTDVRLEMYEQDIKKIEDEMLPFGYILDGVNDDSMEIEENWNSEDKWLIIDKKTQNDNWIDLYKQNKFF